MKRKILTLLLTITLTICCLGLVACVNNGENEESKHQHVFNNEICIGCSQNINDLAIEMYEMSATTNDNVKGYLVKENNNDTKSYLDFYIVGSGDIYNYNDNDLPEYISGYGEKIKNIYISDSITRIGANAFSDCASLTSITIPNGITSIGEYAFYNCSSLVSVTIGTNVTSIEKCAFLYCQKLVEVVNKSNHFTINKGSDLNGLVGYYALSVYNSEDVFTGTKVFVDNEYIVFTYGAKKVLLGYNGNKTYLEIPIYITDIWDGAFWDNTEIENIQIPNSVINIGYGAFYNCTSLKSIVIPNSVICIDENTFYNCVSLESVTIGNGVKTIKFGAFENCDSLTSLEIPNSVTEIRNTPFANCDNLTSVRYKGTIDDWNKITKGTYWWTNELKFTYIQCLDGNVNIK